MASRVNGFNEMVARLNSYSNEVQEDVKQIVFDNMREMSIKAYSKAPDADGLIDTENGPIRESQISSKRTGTGIAGNIGYEPDPSGYKGSVFVEKGAGDIAAYVEFGTGQSAATYLATVPAEWRNRARKFFINGKGTILARPFLLPAFMEQSIIFKKELKEVFKANRL